MFHGNGENGGSAPQRKFNLLGAATFLLPQGDHSVSIRAIAGTAELRHPKTGESEDGTSRIFREGGGVPCGPTGQKLRPIHVEAHP